MSGDQSKIAEDIRHWQRSNGFARETISEKPSLMLPSLPNLYELEAIRSYGKCLVSKTECGMCVFVLFVKLNVGFVWLCGLERVFEPRVNHITWNGRKVGGVFRRL